MTAIPDLFLVAEISGNHGRKIENVFRLIQLAKEAGFDAVKIQTFTPDSITIDHDSPLFRVQDKSSPWYGRKLWDLYKEAQTPRSWHPEIFAYGKELGITVFSTPFAKKDVDYLEKLENPIYKIASFEAIDLNFCRYVFSCNKPTIVSCGILDNADIHKLLRTFVQSTAPSNSAGGNLTLLHCTSEYPTELKHSNMRRVKDLVKMLPFSRIGYSDHTIGHVASTVAVSLGARTIEKHIALSATTIDGHFALQPEDLSLFVDSVRKAAECMNLCPDFYDRMQVHKTNFGRSLFAIKDIQEGDLLTIDNIASIRPGHGYHPNSYYAVLGKTAKRSLPKGTPLNYADS